ncbi:hypothetical protein L207DRAFT_498840 [Hyaloscypha variabilis F]|uniref:Uncharacterized protein n=1 Tax=Hyaloscypha variabilis (strain UAMH 11265 / GT02V1 / F) TaxID=1149755 RepID=A0A2J6R4A6_HYAVF|nr:hypothetical protein L207DRAFT_498840 [Hyaloscypha variabilis F]
MSSIPQLSGSLISATNQNTVGLANFNIDLSIVKITPPEEYARLGISLSQRRRENAEEGPLHRTARKLGLLFEQILPSIPDLIKAYGIRASEIAGVKDTAPKIDTLYGLFSDHAGVDGTSIYAAATSGSSAIALHLLACMLARSWPATVATSIWVELVAERKKELEKNIDDSQLHGLLARDAAQQEISRAALAAWDASARAWLRTADEVKALEQTQLKLIIKNSGLSLNTSGNTYNSVLNAWVMAMKSLQGLIIGSPHNISKASVLLGLLSWHIYPDLNVVDPLADIQFHDPLVQIGGVVTLGLQRADSLGDGVHWSLSLSHLRFYGSPVAVKTSIGSVGSDDGRLTLPELHLVALGCLVSSWRDAAGIDLITAADCLVALGQCLALTEHINSSSDSHGLAPDLKWLRLLINAAKSLLSSHGFRRQQALDLVELGRRRARHFLDDISREFCPMFGLVNPLVLFQFLEEPEEDREPDASIRMAYEMNREYTTIISQAQTSHKRNRNGEVLQAIGYPGCSACSCKLDLRRCTSLCKCAIYVHCRYDCGNLRRRQTHLREPAGDCRWLLSGDIVHNGTNFTWRGPPLQFLQRYREVHKDSADIDYLLNLSGDKEDPHQIRGSLSTNDEILYDRTSTTIELKYRLLIGRQENAALFTLNPNTAIVPPLNLEELTTILRSPGISRQKLLDYLTNLPNSGIYDNTTDRHRTPARDFFISLNALVLASELYQDWPEATVSIEITKRMLGQSRWVNQMFMRPSTTLAGLERPLDGLGLYRTYKFACIAMFESGIHDLHPDQLKNVMAMASGNSIFVAEALLQDPSKQDRSDLPSFTGIRRIVGTLDRPGMVMLVPPQAPKIREPDLRSWKVVHQAAFDGQLRDSFQQTSLHLTFTEYEIPLAIAPGAVDAEVSILETLIFVHDGRTWVGDLDILGSLAKNPLRHLPWCQCITAPKAETFGHLLAKTIGPQLKSITNWEEFLCCKQNLMRTEIGVMRCSNNWIARLAATTLSGGKGYSSLLIPSSSICSNCSERLISGQLWIQGSGENFDLLIT